MPKVSPEQNSFSAGEVSPLIYGRSDSDRYKQALAICINYVPTLEGPITRRPGTQYVHECRHSSYDSNPLLIPFVYNRSQSYIIETGMMDNGTASYYRFFTNHGLITTGANYSITAVNQSSTCIITADDSGFGHTITSGSRVIVSGIVGMTELNNREFIATSLTSGTFSIQDCQTSATINSSTHSSYISGGSVAKIYEVTATKHAFTANTFKSVQTNDILYGCGSTIVTTGYASTLKLSRYASAQWSVSAIGFVDNMPYLPENPTGTTISPAANTGSNITVTVSSTSGVNNGLGFQSTDTQRMLRIKNGTTWGYAQISSTINTTQVRVNILSDFASTSATEAWRLGAYGEYYGPQAIAFHEDRIFLGGGYDPQYIAASKVGEYEDFGPHQDYTASSGFSLLLNSAEANAVSWLQSDEKGIVVGTSGGPWVLRPAQGEAISAITANAKKTSTHGASSANPCRTDKSSIYVENSGRKIREFIYFYDVDGYRAEDVSILSKQALESGILQLSFQREPYPIVWARRSDGNLSSMIYERGLEDLKVGWARHILGGFSQGSNDPDVLSIATIPATGREEPWMIVKRYINGRTRKTIEYLNKFFDDEDSPEDAHYVDCAVTYDDTATDTIGSLNHLEGEVVSILGDGAVLPDCTVSGGRITLDHSVSTAQIGYPYLSLGKQLRINAGAADGTAMGKTRRTNRVGLMLHRTGGLNVGMDFTTPYLGLVNYSIGSRQGEEITFRDGSDLMSAAVPLYSGIKSDTVEADYNTENQFSWQQTKPLPGTILAIYPQLTTQDR